MPDEFNHTENENPIESVYKEVCSRFAKRKDVTGIDIGFKYKDGKRTSQQSIRLHVKEKRSPDALTKEEIFPGEIRGIPIDVVQANYKPNLQDLTAGESNNRRTKFSKVQPGISVGHFNVNAGTIGLIVKDEKSGKPAILSNWHILAGSRSANKGDDIVQPGPADGGRIPADTVARLERMILGTQGDAAIALLTDDQAFDTTILDLNIIPTNIGDVKVGDIVVKSGRTTRVTKGLVEGKGIYTIEYPTGLEDIEGFRITTIDPENRNNLEISNGGDSGAAWLLENSNTMVGLLFAGELDPSPEKEYALACNATSVFSSLSISLFNHENETIAPQPDH